MVDFASYAFPDFSLPTDSPLKSQATSRAESLLAVTGGPSVTVEVASVYPTIASNHLPSAPVPDSTSRNADFYREGRIKEGDYSNGRPYEYAVEPRRYSGWEYDEKLASIRLYGRAKGKKDKVDLLPAYTKFFLESVQEGHAEKTQVVETFGEFYVYAFGERPPMYSFSGRLMSTKTADWSSDFSFLYDQYLRATRSVEVDARSIITYGGKQVEGLVVAHTMSRQADADGMVPFQIQMIVFDRKFLNFSADFGFSTGDGKSLVQDQGFQKMLDEVTGGRTGLGMSEPGASKSFKVASGVLQNIMPAEGPILA